MLNRWSHAGGRTAPSRHDLVRLAFVLRSNNLSQRVVRGAGFQFLGIALRTLITIGSTASLARLLVPSDFGYVAMATVVTELAAVFANFGFTNVLIQRRVVNRLQMDTVFWASAALGCLLALAVVILSFFAGWLFVDPQVGRLLRVLALNFVIGGLTSVHWAVLARLLRFKTEFWIQTGSVAIRVPVAIAFAYFGFGAWSLVAGALTSAIATLVLSMIAVSYFPRFRFNLAYLTSTWRTSGSYFGGGLVYYLYMNVDLIMIGRTLGPTPLGFYQNARSLTDEIRARIATPLQHVLFPAFSAIQTERRRYQDLVLRSGRLLAAIVFPIGFGVSATASELVPVLYGDQWHAMVPLMSMFGISAALRASTAIVSPLFSASNRVGLSFKYNAISLVVMLAGIALALPHGVTAVGLSIAFTSLYTLVPFRVGLGLIDLDMRHVVQILGPPAAASLVMWLAIEAVRPFSLTLTQAPAALLFGHVAFGIVVYAITLQCLSREFLQDFFDMGSKLLKKS